MTPTDSGPADERTPVPPTKRDELVAQLPDASPLTGTLEELVAAEDRARFASERGLEFREREHSVRVLIELEPSGTLPTGYHVDVVDESQGYVTAYVHVDDLVPLGMDEGVRKIQQPPESRTHSGANSTQP